MARVFAVLAAFVLHAAFLLFGGWFLPEVHEGQKVVSDVELVQDDAAPTEEPPPPPPPPEEATEAPPDAEAAIASLQSPSADSAPALDAMSLGALGDALSGLAGSGEFAGPVSLASGGRIGGTGTGGELDQTMTRAFSLAELDQKPRATMPVHPTYPRTMRGRKIEGVVTLLFVVDSNGNVMEPRVEKSSHAAFEAPAIDAIRRWKFEPAVKGGKRVASRMRLSIRFPPG